MFMIALLSILLIRHTSSVIERTVLILTSAICLLFVFDAIPQLTFGSAYGSFVFLVISCMAALLASWRTAQVMKSKNG